MKEKIVMTITLLISLSMMAFPWFGGQKGIETIYGITLLNNPIALTCIILAFVGIWTNFGKNSEIIVTIGLLGIMTMEIYEFFTWHILTITGHFDFNFSVQLCYPEFYYALFCMIGTYLIYKHFYKSIDSFD